MSQRPSIPAGTRDFGPEVMIRREYIFETIRKVFRKYGYAPLETPAMENLSVLTGKYGEEGDRLIFKILNSGDFLKDVDDFSDAKKLSFQISSRALRYDLTVPFARFVVMNQNDITFPFKRYQIQPVWRADRPQKGRYREFYQCDADVVGSDSLLFEAEFICIYDEAFSNLGFDDFTIMLNNRKILTGYAEVIHQKEKFMDICTAIDKLDKIGEEGVRKELSDRGVSVEGADKLFEIITFEGTADEKLGFLEKAFTGCEEGLKGVAEIREVLQTYRHLSRFAGKVEFNLKLARGLNYYTGTVYEVKVNNFAMGSIGGGGRYADLTGVFGKSGLSGVGISFGADRIYDVMEGLGLFGQISASTSRVLIINFGEDTLVAALHALRTLREAGFAAELYPEKTKIGKQFSYADKKSIPYTLIIGEEEIKTGKYQLKDMLSGEQLSVNMEELIQQLG
ncbi:MAG: histidine--tRNA ligase [Bacteroidia bacterium]